MTINPYKTLLYAVNYYSHFLEQFTDDELESRLPKGVRLAYNKPIEKQSHIRILNNITGEVLAVLEYRNDVPDTQFPHRYVLEVWFNDPKKIQYLYDLIEGLFCEGRDRYDRKMKKVRQALEEQYEANNNAFELPDSL